jgi:protein-histidine N-methyltransferase
LDASDEEADLTEVEITPELKAAFLTSLKDYGIRLRFFAGSWETFDLGVAGGQYDQVLTSETIYRTDSLPSLVNLLQLACARSASSGASFNDEKKIPNCLVAAKIVYFGVGGGVSEFIDTANKTGGQVDSVWETHVGVSRRIMQVNWSGS